MCPFPRERYLMVSFSGVCDVLLPLVFLLGTTRAAVLHGPQTSKMCLLGFLVAVVFKFFLEYSGFHQFSSVQFSHSVESDSLQPHESQHARPPCPSPTPGVYSMCYFLRHSKVKQPCVHICPLFWISFPLRLPQITE